MRRANATLSAAEHQLPPNGIYEAYRDLFDSIFVLERIPEDQLDVLYVFDRADFAAPRFSPPGWKRVELVSNPTAESQIAWQTHFGAQERELFSFLLVDVPGNGKMLRISGSVGTGKSTFVRYMFLRYLPLQPYFADRLFLFVDLQKVLRKQWEYSYDRTVRVVLSEIKEALTDHSRGETDYRRWSDDRIVNLLREYVRHLGTNRVIIIFDNVDPFPVSFQCHLARFCRNLVDVIAGTIVVTTRPLNWTHFASPRDSMASVLYDLPHRPPAAHKVVERRLRHYLAVKLNLRPPRRLRIDKNEFTVTFSDLKQFVEKFLALVFHANVRNALGALSNGNMRLALIWTIDFISSWNLNVPLMVQHIFEATAMHRRATPIDDFDTFVLALGYCNHDVYFPDLSRLDNLFSARQGDGSDHTLIKYRCLKFCSARRGLVRKAVLTEHLRLFGYTESAIEDAVNRLLSVPRILLKSNDGDAYNDVDSLELTPAGRFYLDTLIEHMYYLQVVSDDMLLPDDIQPNQGSKIERMRNLMRLMEHLGRIEFEEIKRFMAAGTTPASQADEYLSIYGREPLCVRMLESLAKFMQGKAPRQMEGPGSVDVSSLVGEVNEVIQACMRHHGEVVNPAT